MSPPRQQLQPFLSYPLLSNLDLLKRRRGEPGAFPQPDDKKDRTGNPLDSRVFLDLPGYWIKQPKKSADASAQHVNGIAAFDMDDVCITQLLETLSAIHEEKVVPFEPSKGLTEYIKKSFLEQEITTLEWALKTKEKKEQISNEDVTLVKLTQVREQYNALAKIQFDMHKLVDELLTQCPRIKFITPITQLHTYFYLHSLGFKLAWLTYTPFIDLVFAMMQRLFDNFKPFIPSELQTFSLSPENFLIISNYPRNKKGALDPSLAKNNYLQACQNYFGRNLFIMFMDDSEHHIAAAQDIAHFLVLAPKELDPGDYLKMQPDGFLSMQVGALRFVNSCLGLDLPPAGDQHHSGQLIIPGSKQLTLPLFQNFTFSDLVISAPVKPPPKGLEVKGKPGVYDFDGGLIRVPDQSEARRGLNDFEKEKYTKIPWNNNYETDEKHGCDAWGRAQLEGKLRWLREEKEVFGINFNLALSKRMRNSLFSGGLLVDAAKLMAQPGHITLAQAKHELIAINDYAMAAWAVKMSDAELFDTIFRIISENGNKRVVNADIILKIITKDVIYDLVENIDIIWRLWIQIQEILEAQASVGDRRGHPKFAEIITNLVEKTVLMQAQTQIFEKLKNIDFNPIIFAALNQKTYPKLFEGFLSIILSCGMTEQLSAFNFAARKKHALICNALFHKTTPAIQEKMRLVIDRERIVISEKIESAGLNIFSLLAGQPTLPPALTSSETRKGMSLSYDGVG